MTGKTIFIVEDTAVFRDAIEAILRREGFEAPTASDGRVAIQMLQHLSPDLVLLDLGLPGTSGLEVLKFIRSNDRLQKVPVIVLSASSLREGVEESARLGITCYLLKSHSSLSKMMESIHRALATTPPQAQAPRNQQATSSDSTDVTQSHAKKEPVEKSTETFETLKALTTRAELSRRLDSIQGPKAFPPAIEQVLTLADNPSCSIDTIATAINTDQAITLKVLKLANSSLYRQREPVNSIQKAVIRIGLKEIRQAVLNIGIIENFSSEVFDKHVSITHFWEHSIACGLIAANIARATAPAEVDSSFTMGLLHDLGRLIYAQELKADYWAVLDTAHRLKLPVEQVETKMLQQNHADVMDRILRAWHMDSNLIAPIAFHHLSFENMRSVAPQQVTQTLRLALADRLSHALLIGNSGNETIYPTQELCAMLNIPDTVLTHIVANASAEVSALKLAMLSHGNVASWPLRAKQHRDNFDFPFNPLFISVHGASDAYRILSDTLRTNQTCPPNVAIVHIASAAETVQVSRQVIADEKEAGVTDLPLIILSPSDKFELDSEVTNNRNTQFIPTPTVLSRLIDVIKQLVPKSSRVRQPAMCISA